MSTYCNSQQQDLCQQKFVVSVLSVVTHGKAFAMSELGFAVSNQLTATSSDPVVLCTGTQSSGHVQ
jgi:adenosylcobinamide amidohydrolase